MQKAGLDPEAAGLWRTIEGWMAPGGVTIGFGDDTGFGGSNVSDFRFSGAVAAATLSVDGKVLIDKGTSKLRRVR